MSFTGLAVHCKQTEWLTTGPSHVYKCRDQPTTLPFANVAKGDTVLSSLRRFFSEVCVASLSFCQIGLFLQMF